jgi:hypothetical protein
LYLQDLAALQVRRIPRKYRSVRGQWSKSGHDKSALIYCARFYLANLITPQLAIQEGLYMSQEFAQEQSTEQLEPEFTPDQAPAEVEADLADEDESEEDED